MGSRLNLIMVENIQLLLVAGRDFWISRWSWPVRLDSVFQFISWSIHLYIKSPMSTVSLPVSIITTLPSNLVLNLSDHIPQLLFANIIMIPIFFNKHLLKHLLAFIIIAVPWLPDLVHLLNSLFARIVLLIGFHIFCLTLTMVIITLILILTGLILSIFVNNALNSILLALLFWVCSFTVIRTIRMSSFVKMLVFQIFWQVVLASWFVWIRQISGVGLTGGDSWIVQFRWTVHMLQLQIFTGFWWFFDPLRKPIDLACLGLLWLLRADARAAHSGLIIVTSWVLHSHYLFQGMLTLWWLIIQISEIKALIRTICVIFWLLQSNFIL